ncbi:MAG: 5'/3'-nucleotidase SurE [Alphaproteobacteria bacterium]
MRILLSNDDGINAPGLKSLTKIAKALSDDVWIVAPEAEQSGAGHSLTLSDPLRLRKISARKYAVKGTPTDCVMMAVREIMTDRKPDLVLSGVNRGGNIADDVTYSGTIAAAMEGTLLGVPSIALSQVYGWDGSAHVPWETAEHFGPKVVAALVQQGFPKDVLLNVNFPSFKKDEIKGVAVTRQGRRDQSVLTIDKRADGRGHDYYWLGFERRMSNPPKGTDLYAIYNAMISVTPLHLNLTQKSAMKGLEAGLKGLTND